jgi:hypothetical protein
MWAIVSPATSAGATEGILRVEPWEPLGLLSSLTMGFCGAAAQLRYSAVRIKLKVRKLLRETVSKMA